MFKSTCRKEAMDMLSDLAVKKLSPQPSTNSSRSSSPRCRKLKPSSDQNNRKYRKLKPSSDRNNRQTPVLFQVTTQVLEKIRGIVVLSGRFTACSGPAG